MAQRTKHPTKYRFEIVRKKKGKQKFYWRLIACNGRIVCHSETMHVFHAPLKTIKNLVGAIKKGEFKIVERLIGED